KGQFLATMSHELRTPLNSVIGFARQLQKNKAGNLLPQDLTFVERIGNSGAHLLQIINDILDLSRIEAGKAFVERSSVAIHHLINDVVSEVTSDPLVQKRNVSVGAFMPATLTPVLTDESKLRRILTNLLSNATKFTENGQVRVVVVANAERIVQRIDVVDTGIGIPAERLSAIFEMFEQADNSTQRRFGGTGLGLAICRTLAELLGYRLGVVSEPGVGSAFSVLLEADAPAPRRYAEAASNIAPAHALT
ncbi:MAG TPA: ATP-binding protein, partial [Gemmatimonadaceae bacterium]|nr:ATP-binding protein [Gemmatimonadaceae bacterium]